MNSQFYIVDEYGAIVLVILTSVRNGVGEDGRDYIVDGNTAFLVENDDLGRRVSGEFTIHLTEPKC